MACTVAKDNTAEMEQEQTVAVRYAGDSFRWHLATESYLLLSLKMEFTG